MDLEQKEALEIKEQILALAAIYFKKNFKNRQVEPGKDTLAANGKVLDEADLKMLLCASLDMWLTSGSYGQAFEKAFAQKCGSRYALLVNSGSSANLLAVSALTSPLLKEKRLKTGDEFITAACGFPTTVNPGIQQGLIPIFIDVDPKIHNITPELVEAAITPKTKLVIAAHTLGNPFDAKKIAEICKTHGIWFVEDCCDALGSQLYGQPVGTFGSIGTASFYPAHHITTGEGGAVFTNSSVLKKILESFRDWGRDCYCPPGCENTCGKRYDWQMGDLPKGYDHKYIYTHIGYNLKATDMQAAIGLSQLEKLDQFVAKRKQNFNQLTEKLKHLGGEDFYDLAQSLPYAEPSWFGFLLTIKDSKIDRSRLLKFLGEAKIGTRLLFGGDLTKQPAYQHINYKISGQLEHTSKILTSSFYVGIWPGLEEPALEYIAIKLIEGIKNCGC